MKLSEDQHLWLESVWKHCEQKLKTTSRRMGDSFPFVSIDHQYRNRDAESYLSWWTNGFWPGMLWLLYRETGDEFYLETAQSCEKLMDQVLLSYTKLDHDIGFLWSLLSVSSYKITKNEQSRSRALLAASVLASRYNIKGRFIRAWNSEIQQGKAIVDSMMNMPLLYWASIQTNDRRFAHIADDHIFTVMRHFQRPDGSMNHIMRFDPETGELIENIGGQGYEAGSSWSRGQAWALYGFALCYSYSHNSEHLDAAKRVAHYFIANVCHDWLPDIDFKAPALAMNKDSTAGAIAAAGLLHIADNVSVHEQSLYRDSAFKLLRTLNETCTSWDSDEEGLLLHGSHAYHHDNPGSPNDTPIIYGDYFFLEAILRLRGQTDLFWLN